MNPSNEPTRSELLAMTLLGLDYGGRRVGVALKPAGQSLVLPRQVLVVRDEADAVAQVRAVLTETGAAGIVVGLPQHADPTQARAVKRFCRKAREGQSGVRWFFVDESLTSQEARSISLETPAGSRAHAGGRAGSPGRPIDDLAAALILERFLLSSRAD